MAREIQLPWEATIGLIKKDWAICEENGSDVVAEILTGQDGGEVYAKFIVKACNNHYKLLAACEQAYSTLVVSHNNLLTEVSKTKKLLSKTILDMKSY